MAGSSASMLPDGRVLTSGGINKSRCLIYNPNSDEWIYGPDMIESRVKHSSVTLSDGRVFVSGGLSRYDANKPVTISNSCEIFDMKTNSWKMCKEKMTTPRYVHELVLLDDGRVLIIGGFVASNSSIYTGSCEIYDPISDTFCEVANKCPSLVNNRCVKMPNGHIVSFGADDPKQTLFATYNYDSKSDKWTVIKETEKIYSFTLHADSRYIPLSNGMIFISDSCEKEHLIYDPVANTTKVLPQISTDSWYYSFCTVKFAREFENDVDVEAMFGDIKNAAKTK
jgi:hypothetical protein